MAVSFARGGVARAYWRILYLWCLILVGSLPALPLTPSPKIVPGKTLLALQSLPVPAVSDVGAVPEATEASTQTEESSEPSEQGTDNAFASSTASGTDINDDDGTPIFDIVAGRAAVCLFESDKRRDAKAEHSKLVSSSTTNWINDATAFALQKALDKLKVQLAEERTGLDRDEASAWIRWMKSSPTTMIVDFSKEFREIANTTIVADGETFEMLGMTRTDFLSRLGCRMILLPSGAALSSPLWEPPASLVYGKLLYGGVTRYRRLVSSNSSRRPPRTAGERTAIKVSARENIPVWIQYGGAERMYEAVDMGPAAVLEVLLLPRGSSLGGPDAGHRGSGGADEDAVGDMVVKNLVWKPQRIFNPVPEVGAHADTVQSDLDFVSGYTPISQAGKSRNDAFKSDFKSSVGGLQPQIDSIVRRVLDGRVIRPAQEDDNIVEKDEESAALAVAAMEAEELAILGLTPIRGLLLYGPPGTGKTLLARQIARALRARTPKVVSAPELLDRWVGGSEKLVRSLFSEAEAELAACNGDATRSALHVIVIDEIDAVFRRRSSGEDSGEATRASVVNQILSKLDGVRGIDNILLVGMTNRRELLDEALLRPGRLEVQIEVPLPDKVGRREILQIHFDALRRNGRLSKPLCCAIDGVTVADSISNTNGTFEAQGMSAGDQGDSRVRKRDAFKRAIQRAWSGASSVVRPTYDLAAEYATGGFSGADIAGLVRCAGSLALSRSRRDGNGVEGLLITLEDVKLALDEIRPTVAKYN